MKNASTSTASQEVRIPLSTLFQPSNGAPTTAGPSCATTLRLDDALARLGREAQHGFCDTGRYRMPFYAWGEGPALVVIPGMADDRLSFATVCSRLAQHFCCIAYDLPTGRGDGASLGRIRHADLVADLLALLDSLRIRRCFVLGSSFGSTIALAAAHRRPERFDRLLLQGGFAHRPLSLGEESLAAFARYWPWDMKELPLRNNTLRLTHYRGFERQPPEFWEFFLKRCGDPPMAAVARRAMILQQLDLRPLLPKLHQPVLAICGDYDPIVGKDCEADLLQGLPHIARAEIEECGHMPHFTHPEIFCEIVERFLGVKEGCEIG